MPHIRFTETPVLPADIRHLNYQKGDVVELPQASCDRWIRRNVAVPCEAPVEPEAQAQAEAEAAEKAKAEAEAAEKAKAEAEEKAQAEARASKPVGKR